MNKECILKVCKGVPLQFDIKICCMKTPKSCNVEKIPEETKPEVIATI